MDANFWFQKGYAIQIKGEKNCEQVALDYYLSGIKIDKKHIGCIHNAACCYYLQGKFANAEKWFSLAIQADPTNQESYIGKTVAKIKLGDYESAFKTIDQLGQMPFASKVYKPEQSILLFALCARLLQKWPQCTQAYN